MAMATKVSKTLIDTLRQAFFSILVINRAFLSYWGGIGEILIADTSYIHVTVIASKVGWRPRNEAVTYEVSSQHPKPTPPA